MRCIRLLALTQGNSAAVPAMAPALACSGRCLSQKGYVRECQWCFGSVFKHVKCFRSVRWCEKKKNGRASNCKLRCTSPLTRLTAAHASAVRHPAKRLSLNKLGCVLLRAEYHHEDGIHSKTSPAVLEASFYHSSKKPPNKQTKKTPYRFIPALRLAQVALAPASRFPPAAERGCVFVVCGWVPTKQRHGISRDEKRRFCLWYRD